MSNDLAAAAASDVQAPSGAPAESEQATPNAGIPKTEGAAPENAENDQADQSGEGSEQLEDDKPQRLSRYQRLQRTKARLATMVAEQQAELEQLRKASKGAASDAPKAQDYAQGEYDPAYLSDLAAHKAATKIKESLDEGKAQDAKQKAADARAEAAEDFIERAEELKASILDFDATFEAFVKAGGSFAPHVIEELHESEKGPLLAYQLAKNPALAASLNQMSPRDVAREIGRLEAKASLPQQRKQTQAPAPIRPPAGGASPTASLMDLAKAGNMDAYVKARNAQEADRKR